MSVQPPSGDDDKLPEAESFDAPDLEIIDKQIVPYHDQHDRSHIGDVELGDKARDQVSGFEGVAIARHMFLNGYDSISIQPALKKKNTPLPDVKSFDAPQLKVTKREYIQYETSVEERREVGGPAKFMPDAKENDGRRAG